MAWNAPPNPSNHAHPPPPYGNNQGFWEFMRSLNLNAGSPEAGAGIDHTMPSPPAGFFPFGPSGGAGPDSFNPWFGGWGHRGRHGRRHGPGVNNNDEGSDTDHHHHRHGRRGSRHGRGGRGGRHGRHNHESHTPSETEEDLYDITAAAGAAESELFDSFDNEKQTTSTSTLRDDNTAGEHPDPPEEIPTSSSCPPGGRRGRRGGFGGRCGRGHHAFPRHFPSPPHHGGPHHPPHHGGPHPAPPPPPFGGPFGGWGGFPGGPRPHREGAGRGSVDLTGIMNNLGGYMRDYWQNYRRGQQQAQGAGVDAAGDDAFVDEETLTPPADIFNTPTGWTIHLAIPGAKKQDVAVHWDADNSSLVVSGIVYRPGDEQFLSGMVSGERRVGLFERKIELPPAGGEGQEKEEVDGNRITAKLEDGVLVVVVGKAEKEWTEVRKVDIE